ncbi:MAG TPA: ATP-dependent sacrificial sulfur transferase LarE [archaeon]|nr:ATP-dependent sacrificial sulfur transferase LarE [archaeon]
MDKELKELSGKIISEISKKKSAIIALSGGVDSATVCALAFRALGKNLTAVTITSEALSQQDLDDAKSVAKKIGVRHIVVEVDKLSDKGFRENSKLRCYFCRKMDTREMLELKEKLSAEVIIDGAHVEDLGDFRPGMKAMSEAKVWSPFIEFGITKNHIREIAKEFSLHVFDKPAGGCTSSRIPHGTPITAEALIRVEKSEEFLRSLGFKALRVRDYGESALVQIDNFEQAQLMQGKIISALENFGYKSISIEKYIPGAWSRKEIPTSQIAVV